MAKTFESLQEYEAAQKPKSKGGRPPAKNKRYRLTPEEGEALLYEGNAPGIVELLEQCSGDLEAFIYSFNAATGTKQSILARAIYTLAKEGNEEHLAKWNKLVRSHQAAKVQILEAEALGVLENMPTPRTSDSLLDWQRYATLWLSPIRKEIEARNKAELKPKDDDEQKNRREMAAVEAMVAAIKATSSG